jgi:uncharacterized membrane protein YfcA
LIDTATFIIFLTIGGFVGFVSGLLGVGGGFILVPLLVALGIPTHEAIGSSLLFIFFAGLSGAIQHRRQNNLDFKIALPILGGSVLTAQIGAYTTLFLEDRWLQIALSIILIILAIAMIIDSRKSNLLRKETDAKNRRSITLTALAIGLVTGFVSGLLGVGGGFMLVPLLITVLHVPTHLAIGTSLIAVIGSAFSGTMAHLLIGNVNLLLVVVLSASGSLMAPLGAKSCSLCSQKWLRTVFSVVLFILAVILLCS